MKEDILLTSEERAVVMGGLLGDSTLQKRGKDSYRLSMGHSVKQTYYTLWKYNKLKRLCKTTKPPYIDTQTKTDGKEHNVITFYTSTDNTLAGMYPLFYKNGEKVITPELIQALPRDPLLLAVWYLDDGSTRTDANSGRIATQSFTKEGCELLCSYIHEFGVDARLNWHDKSKNQHTVVLPASTFSSFAQLIKPYVDEIPDMLYKLGKKNQ